MRERRTSFRWIYMQNWHLHAIIPSHNNEIKPTKNGFHTERLKKESCTLGSCNNDFRCAFLRFIHTWAPYVCWSRFQFLAWLAFILIGKRKTSCCSQMSLEQISSSQTNQRTNAEFSYHLRGLLFCSVQLCFVRLLFVCRCFIRCQLTRWIMIIVLWIAWISDGNGPGIVMLSMWKIAIIRSL